MVAAACSSGDDAAPAPASTEPRPPSTAPASVSIGVEPWEPTTRSEELAAAMSSGEVTMQDAVDAFGLHVEGFPGATPTALPAGDTISASYAVSLILPLRDELAAEQQTALDRYVTADDVIAEIPGDAAIAGDAEIPGDAEVPGGPETTEATEATAPAGWRRPSAATAQHYGDLLQEVLAAWKARLANHPRQDVYQLHWFDDPGESGMATFETVAADGKVVCHVKVHTSFRDGGPSDDKIRFYFAHELFHCIQWRWTATRSVDTFQGFPLSNPHPWLYDGSAEWAAADLYRQSGIGYNDIRPTWFGNSVEPLYARSYDAWPLFENAALSHHDVYGAIRDMIVSPLWDVAGTLAVGGLDGVQFRMRWASRTLRREGWGDDWELAWVWRGHEQSPPLDNDVPVAGIGLGSSELNGVGGFAQPPFGVPVSSAVGIVTVAPSGAPLTTRTVSGTRTVGDGGVMRLCFDPSGCVCPAGQTSDAWAMEPGGMIVSFAAADEPPRAAMFAEEWDPERHCDEEPPDTGSSNGDPHLVTFDGLAYDVVTLGEFVLARDPVGDFEVQTRHEPFGFGAGTTAFAVTDGATRLTVTMPEFHTDERPTVRVDGSLEAAPGLLAGSLRVTVTPDDVTVVWPDGSRVAAQWFLGWFVTVVVPSARSARMEGLLGSADGDLRNDLQIPSAGVVDSSDAEADGSPFALAWAVDDATSLFDYEPGESVATFRVPHPEPLVPPPDRALEERCASALGDEAAAHEVAACAYDVAATGDDGFVERYATVVDERGDPPVLAAPTVTRPSPAPLNVGSVVEGRPGEPALRLDVDTSGTVRAVAGSALVARVPTCPDDAHVDVVVVDTRDRDDLARAALCDSQGNGEAYVWLPDDGDYLVVIDGVLGASDELDAVEVFVDPSPLVLRAGDLEAGAELHLRGIADTAVLLPDPAARYDIEPADACAAEIYWNETFPDPEPRTLDGCEHRTEYDQPPTDQIVPLVVFSRSDAAIDVRLTPQP